MGKISVLIVDDHPVVCEGIRVILASSTDVTLVGEAASDEAAIRALATRPADVVLLDLVCAERRLDIISQILEAAPDTVVLVFTASHDPEQQREALLAGARGIVTMDKPCSVLLEAIRKVACGELWFERRHLEAVARRFVRSRDVLTKRQAQILALIGEGLTNAEIAQRLPISEKTVRNHLTAIFDKFDVSDRLKLLVYAHQNGLLSVSANEVAGAARTGRMSRLPGTTASRPGGHSGLSVVRPASVRRTFSPGRGRES